MLSLTHMEIATWTAIVAAIFLTVGMACRWYILWPIRMAWKHTVVAAIDATKRRMSRSAQRFAAWIDGIARSAARREIERKAEMDSLPAATAAEEPESKPKSKKAKGNSQPATPAAATPAAAPLPAPVAAAAAAVDGAVS